MPEYTWNKPAICIFKEREKPEVDPFVVIKAKKITISKSAKDELTGTICDFFTLMGDCDYLSTAKGAVDHYVMCWFDDTEPDTNKDLRRLRGVTFTSKVTYTLNKSGKRTYNADFKAEQGKLK